MGIFEALKACKRILCMQQANSEVFGESIAAQKIENRALKRRVLMVIIILLIF
jgi:hypothetical protein